MGDCTCGGWYPSTLVMVLTRDPAPRRRGLAVPQEVLVKVFVKVLTEGFRKGVRCHVRENNKVLITAYNIVYNI